MRAAAPAWADVAPIFRDSCSTCHGGSSPAAGLSLASYAGIKKGGVSGPAISPGNPAASLVVKRIHGTVKPQMPLGGDPLPTAQRQKIEEWIRAGALEKAQGEPTAKAPAAPPAPPVESAPKAGEPVLYQHVARIFGQRCVKCHMEQGQMGGPPEGYRLDSYERALSSGERANIIPGNPNASRLIRFVKGHERPRMPFDGPPFLSEDEIRLLSDWIGQGARDSSGRRGPIPVGREVRYEGRLDRRWVVDGIVLSAAGARIDKNPAPGDRVEVRGRVGANGQIIATRIRAR